MSNRFKRAALILSALLLAAPLRAQTTGGSHGTINQHAHDSATHGGTTLTPVTFTSPANGTAVFNGVRTLSAGATDYWATGSIGPLGSIGACVGKVLISSGNFSSGSGFPPYRIPFPTGMDTEYTWAAIAYSTNALNILEAYETSQGISTGTLGSWVGQERLEYAGTSVDAAAASNYCLPLYYDGYSGVNRTLIANSTFTISDTWMELRASSATIKHRVLTFGEDSIDGTGDSDDEHKIKMTWKGATFGLGMPINIAIETSTEPGSRTCSNFLTGGVDNLIRIFGDWQLCGGDRPASP